VLNISGEESGPPSPPARASEEESVGACELSFLFLTEADDDDAAETVTFVSPFVVSSPGPALFRDEAGVETPAWMPICLLSTRRPTITFPSSSASIL